MPSGVLAAGFRSGQAGKLFNHRATQIITDKGKKLDTNGREFSRIIGREFWRTVFHKEHGPLERQTEVVDGRSAFLQGARREGRQRANSVLV